MEEKPNVSNSESSSKNVNDLDCEELGLSPAMITALFKRPHDRQFIIDKEQAIINFIDSNQNSLELRPMNSYYRMLSHQIAEYHHLRHVIARSNDVSVILFKVEDTHKFRNKKPLLKSLEPLYVTENKSTVSEEESKPANNSAGNTKKFKILKRSKSKDDAITDNSSQENIQLTSETPETPLQESNNSSSSALLEEQRLKKEEEYNQIRQNLFENVNGDEVIDDNSLNDEDDGVHTDLSEVFGDVKTNNDSENQDTANGKDESTSAPYYRVKIVQEKFGGINDSKNGASPQPDEFQTSRNSLLTNQEYQYHYKGYQNRNSRRSFHSSNSASSLGNDMNPGYKSKNRSGSFTRRSSNSSINSRRSSYNNNSEYGGLHYGKYMQQIPQGTPAGFPMPYMMYPPHQMMQYQQIPHLGMFAGAGTIPIDGAGVPFSTSAPYMYPIPIPPTTDGINVPGNAAGSMTANFTPFSPSLPNGVHMSPIMVPSVPRYNLNSTNHRSHYSSNNSESKGYTRNNKYQKNSYRNKITTEGGSNESFDGSESEKSIDNGSNNNDREGNAPSYRSRGNENGNSVSGDNSPKGEDILSLNQNLKTLSI